MVCYIYFKINGRELMINEDDSDDMRTVVVRKNQYDKVGKSYIQKPVIHTCRNGYKNICLDRKKWKAHRLVYYAHNRDWNIYDNSKTNIIDHIDNDKANNNINNLRVVTAQQNCFNRKTTKGYYWYQSRNKWRSVIVVNGKSIHLGLHTTEEEARESYLTAKLKYHVI